MTGAEIIKLLDELIGDTTAIGSEGHDKNALKNLKTLIDVTNWCLDGVSQSAYTRHHVAHSMRVTGETAFGALAEWREWLTERIEYD